MTHKKISRKSLRRIRMTLYFVSILLLIIAVCAGIVGMRFYFSHLTAPKQTGLGGVLSGPKNDYIMIGSSHTALSYILPDMEKAFKAKVYAISYNGLNFSLMLPILEILVKKGILDDTNLIVECYTGTSVVPPNLQDVQLFYHAPPALKKDIIKLLEDNGHLSNKNLFYLLFSSSNDDIITSPITNRIIDRIFYHGIQTSIKSPGMSEAAFAKVVSPVKGKGLCLAPKNIEALHKIIKLLQDHKINTVFVESPMPAAIESDPSYTENKQTLRKIITKSGFPYIDGALKFKNDDHNMFMDAGHLSSAGRKIFTAKVITAIQSRKNSSHK